MKWLYILLGFLGFGFSLHTNAQHVPDTLCAIIPPTTLPKAAQKAKFRILVRVQHDSLKSLFREAKAFTNKNKINSYILIQEGKIKYLIGDFSDKKYAKTKIAYLKKKIPKAKIVKAESDSMIAFFIPEKKKPNTPSSTESGNKSYAVRYEPPISQKELVVKAKPQPTQPSPKTETVQLENPTANTASKELYLTEKEKMVYYYLNLVRMDPKGFVEKYLSGIRNSKDSYESSLIKELLVLKPLQPLKPNYKLFESALCHAEESGKSGYTGHTRTKCAKYFMGECCQYGISDPLKIVIELLIDQGIPSLGHRKICLDVSFSELGVSMQPHKVYGVNTVLDFK